MGRVHGHLHLPGRSGHGYGRSGIRDGGTYSRVVARVHDVCGAEEVGERAVHPCRGDGHRNQNGHREHKIKRLIQIQTNEHHWWKLGGCCKQEPNDALFPKQVPQSKCTCTATAQAKQATEHDDEQDKVGTKHRNEGCRIGLHVGNAAEVVRMPRRVNPSDT